MTNADSTLRAVILYAVAVPLAIIVGVELASQDPRVDLMTWIVVGSVLFLIAIPLVLKWHHLMLFLFWNTFTVAFVLPGRPRVWLVLALGSLLLALLQRALLTNVRFLRAPTIVAPLSFLALVVVVTAYMRGGLGMSILGSSTVGSMRYILIFGAMAGFLAMIARPIPPYRATTYLGFFFLGEFMNGISIVAPLLPSSAYILLMVFPVESMQALAGHSEVSSATPTIWRNIGLSGAFMSGCFYLLARYGARRMLAERPRWRLGLFVLLGVGSLIGGFRSILVMLTLTCFFIFWFERLLISRYTFAICLAGIVGFATIIPLADKLPLSIQRALTILPLELDPVARADAEASSRWRLEIWKRLLPEVPQYLWLGKGMTMNAKELETATAFNDHGQDGEGTNFVLSGDYHNGPLSVVIPFGIWGVLGFLWFLGASIHALHSNLRYGPQELQATNVLLLSLFMARMLFFLFVFGGFYGDIAHFLGIIGLSISLNGGVRKPAVAVPRPKAAPVRLRPRFRYARTVPR